LTTGTLADYKRLQARQTHIALASTEVNAALSVRFSDGKVDFEDGSAPIQEGLTKMKRGFTEEK